MVVWDMFRMASDNQLFTVMENHGVVGGLVPIYSGLLINSTIDIMKRPVVEFRVNDDRIILLVSENY